MAQRPGTSDRKSWHETIPTCGQVGPGSGVRVLGVCCVAQGMVGERLLRDALGQLEQGGLTFDPTQPPTAL